MKEIQQKNKKLRQYLDAKCLSVKDFSDISNINYSCLHAVVNGHRSPSRKTACLIVRATKGQITLQDFGFE